MKLNQTTKISSEPFDQITSVDFFLHSFVTDIDLCPKPRFDADGYYLNDSYEEFKASKSYQLRRVEKPYCPHFALSSGDMKSRRFEFEGKFMEFIPGPLGLPTVRDFDILLYCTSWLGNAVMQERHDDVANFLEFEVDDFYKFSGRARGDERDNAFVQALDRLSTSFITTNTKPLNHNPARKSVPYIPEYKLTRDDSGKIKTVWLRIQVRLCGLMRGNYKIVYDKSFFELSPVRRAIYMFVSLYCSQYEEDLTVTFAKLHQAVGATSPLRKFIAVIEELQEKPLPSFTSSINSSDETITFKSTRARGPAYGYARLGVNR